MNPAAAWLDQLAPDRLPAASSWWPIAPGWWLISLLLILAIVLGLRYWLHPFRRLQRLALSELSEIRQKNQYDPRLVARDLEHLLRRYAVARYGKNQVAALHNDSWLTFMAEHGLEEADLEPARQLLIRAYGGTGPEPVVQWLTLTEKFLRYHP